MIRCFAPAYYNFFSTGRCTFYRATPLCDSSVETFPTCTRVLMPKEKLFPLPAQNCLRSDLPLGGAFGFDSAPRTGRAHADAFTGFVRVPIAAMIERCTHVPAAAPCDACCAVLT